MPERKSALIIAAHAQLRLARHLASDLRVPWERPAPPSRLTPARVRRDFRNIRAKTTCPASAPKTRQTRPRAATRIEEPPTGGPPRRGQERQEDLAKGPHEGPQRNTRSKIEG